MPYDEFGNWYDDGTDLPPADYGFGGAFGQMSPEALAMQNYMTGAGMDPSGLDPAILQLLAGANPGPMNKYGEPEPFDTSARASGVNLIQDIYGSTTQNPMFAYLGGPGSYAPGALDPVMDETPVPLMGEARLRSVATRGGLDGFMAKLILGLDDEGNATASPMSASAAAATVRRLIEEEDPEAMALAGEIDQLTDQRGVAQGPDWNSLSKRAAALEAPLLDDLAMQNQPNMMQRPDGTWVQVAQRPSPQMEWLQKMGLPDPRARYDIEYAVQNDPTLMSMMTRIADTQEERDAQRQAFSDYLKRRDKEREATRAQEKADAEAMERWQRRNAGAEFGYRNERSTTAGGPSIQSISQGDAPRPRQMTFAEAEEAGLLTPGMRSGVQQRPWIGELPNKGIDWPDLPSWMGALNPLNPVSEAVERGGSAVAGALQQRRTRPLELEAEPDLQRITNIGDMGRGLRLAPQAVLDRVLPENVRRWQNFQVGRKKDRERNALTWEKYARLAPILNAGRAGRTPASDAIAQRLAPLFAAGG